MNRIIGLVNQVSGSCYHRVYTPLMNIEGNVFITNKLTEEQIEKGCDALVINRFAFYNQPDEIFNWRDKYGFKLIIDIDDYWNLSAGHILAYDWEINNVSNIIIDNLIKADIVTCTHQRLAESASIYNKNVHILPNAIPNNFEQFNLNKVESLKVRFMWQGSITHGRDIELLRNPMKKIHSDYFLSNKIKMVFGGHVKELIDSNSMLDAFTCGLKNDPLVIPGLKPTEYYQIYNYADVALIPLVDNKFNSYKSNLKILEAAHAGIPVIVSHVNPYLDFPDDCVIYVKNQRDWYNNIKMFADIPYSRKLIGDNLKEYCNKNFNFKEINLKRKEIYETK